MLAALAARVADGRGISDATWTRDVQEVGMALWPDDASAEHLSARRDHTNLTHIAGDMAGRLAGNDAARAEWLASDPLSVRVHDGFVTASGAGSAAYRAWVVGDGRALLEERFADAPGRAPAPLGRAAHSARRRGGWISRIPAVRRSSAGAGRDAESPAADGGTPTPGPSPRTA